MNWEMKIPVDFLLPLVLVLSCTNKSQGGISQNRISPTTSVGMLILLKNEKIAPEQPDFQPPIPWGKEIRFMGAAVEQCVPVWRPQSLASFLLLEVAERIGPVSCVKGYDRENAAKIVEEGIVDVLAQQRWEWNTTLPFLYPVGQNDICVIIRRIEPQRQSITQAYTPATWVAMCMGLATMAVAQRLAERRLLPLEALRAFISGGFLESRHPVANFLSLTLSIYGMIMVTGFCSKLVSFLTVTKEAVQPQTLEEVEARVTRLYNTYGINETNPDTQGDDILKKLLLKSRPFKSNRDIAMDVMTSTQSAFFISKIGYERIRRLPVWVDKLTGRSISYLVPQCVLEPAYGVHFVNPQWPHTERFSALVQRAVEAGIPIKVKSILQYHMVQKGEWVQEFPPSDDPQPLALAAMLQPLVLLGSGAALAAAVFVGELTVYRLRLRSRR